MELEGYKRERGGMVGKKFKYLKSWDRRVLAETPILYEFPDEPDEECNICVAYDLYTVYETRAVTFKDKEEFLAFSLFQRPNWTLHMNPFKKQANIWTHATVTENKFYD